MMEVDMVRLRRSGSKLKPEEVRATAPVRGELSVFLQRGVVMATLLLGNTRQDEIPPLQAPRITRMKGSSFLLVGIERIDNRKETHHYPQAWWCRLPAQAAEPAVNIGVTLSREERRVARAERG